MPIEWSGRTEEFDSPPADEIALASHRQVIEPWLSALFQTEHLSALVGSGFTIGLADVLGASALDMSPAEFSAPHAGSVQNRAEEVAASSGRASPNIEDQFRAVLELIGGLGMIDADAKIVGGGVSTSTESIRV